MLAAVFVWVQKQKTMSNTSAVAEDYIKIQKAAVMSCDEWLFKNITQMVEYRKKVAQDIINCKDEETTKNLRNIYERFEWHLKELLVLS